MVTVFTAVVAVLLSLAGTASARADDGGALLVNRKLFDPLIADPRWAHFSAAYHSYQNNEGQTDLASVSFGDLFTLYTADSLLGGRWALGFQAAVFAVFDLGAESKDLLNADYWVGIPVTWRDGRWSAITRLYHQSSHLGDEFLLGNHISRVNLSYEALDAKLSYDASAVARIYGGLGVLLHREPSDLERWSAQLGAEFRGPWTLLNGLMRPVAGLDLQFLEDNGWQADCSLRAGIQLEGREESSYTVQIMAEYFNGRNPNGQFYVRDVEYYGLGLHVYF